MLPEPPQSHLGRLRAENALGHFVRVLLAAQCPLQTSPVTQPRVCYIHSVMHMRLISYTAFSDSHPDKTFAPSLTGDINAQSSHWNSGKMKSAYDSAYVQIETLNFTFAQQAFTVSLF